MLMAVCGADAAPLGVVDVAHIIRVDVQGGGRATTTSAADSPSSSSKSDAGKRKVFEVETSSGRVYVLAAETEDNARRWVETLHLVLQAPKISTPSAPLSWTQNEAPDLPGTRQLPSLHSSWHTALGVNW
jgi:hypothetical protein